MKKKKLVLVISSLRGGGAERVMANLANHWALNNVDICLVTLDSPTHEDKYSLCNSVNRKIIYQPSGINVTAKLYANARRLLRLRSMIRDEQADAVLSFMTPTNLLVILATRGLKTRCVVAERICPIKYSYGLLINFLRFAIYRYADCIVAQTIPTAKWLGRHTQAKAIVIPNSIVSSCVSKYNNSPREKIIISVGRLTYQKGFDLLIKAFAYIHLFYPDWRLEIFGEGEDQMQLETLIASQGLQGFVKLKGWDSKLSVHLNRSSIFVIPSRFEGFPNALLEAMANGLPAVASLEAGSMLIKDGVNGLLVPINDVSKLKKAIIKLIEDSDLRLKLGLSATEVNIIYSHERIISLWNSVLLTE